MKFSDFFDSKKDLWVQAHGYRTLKSPHGLDFCSNDYLSFSNRRDLNQRIQKATVDFPLGSGGSRLVRGHSECIDKLEKKLAQFCGQQSSLFLPTGFQTNLALFSTLLKEKAVVFSDESIHASIIDGIKLSGCEKYIWSHNNVKELELLLQHRRRPEQMNFVVVESLYSMQGDQAPLNELVELCERYESYLIVDEAHATGLFGERGSGLVEAQGLSQKVFATVHTAGKALGVSGAWVSGSQELRELLINQSRAFIFSTAPSYFQQIAVSESLDLLAEIKDEIYPIYFRKLKNFQEMIFTLAEENGFRILAQGGPITSLHIGENKKALDLMNFMQNNHFDVRAIRPPAVPKGEALLRLTLPMDRTASEIDSFVQTLEQGLKEIQ